MAISNLIIDRQLQKLLSVEGDKMKIEKVYIASPYGRRRGLTDEQCEQNVNYAISVARELIQFGYKPFVPHLYHFIHIGWTASPDESVWLEICQAWLFVADCVLRMGGESEGADDEVNLAVKLGIPVFYSVKELRKWK